MSPASAAEQPAIERERPHRDRVGAGERRLVISDGWSMDRRRRLRSAPRRGRAAPGRGRQRSASAEMRPCSGSMLRPERELVRLGRAERDVPAFAGDRHPKPAGLDQRADAEPGAGPEHDLGAGAPRRARRRSAPGRAGASAVSASASASKSLRRMTSSTPRRRIMSRGRITQCALVRSTASPAIGPARSMIAERGRELGTGEHGRLDRGLDVGKIGGGDRRKDLRRRVARRGSARSGHWCRRCRR